MNDKSKIVTAGAFGLLGIGLIIAEISTSLKERARREKIIAQYEKDLISVRNVQQRMFERINAGEYDRRGLQALLNDMNLNFKFEYMINRIEE